MIKAIKKVRNIIKIILIYHQIKKKNKYDNNNTNTNTNISNNNLTHRSSQPKNKINLSSIQNSKDDEYLNNIIDFLSYNGTIENLPNYIKNLIEKAEISNLILKYFCADGRDLYNGYRKAEEVVLNKEKREKYFEEEIEMYQNLCEELLKRNQNKINNEELQNYFKEIYKVKNIIEKKY